MKKYKLFVFLPLLGLTLAGCDTGGNTSNPLSSQDPTISENDDSTATSETSEIVVDPVVANTRVAQAMAKMMLDPIEAIELDVEAGGTITIEEDYEQEDSYNVDATINYGADLSLNAKMTGLDSEDPNDIQAAINADVILNGSHSSYPEDSFALDAQGDIYVDTGMVYLSLTGEFGPLFGGDIDVPEEIKGKATFEDMFGTPDEEMFELPVMTSEEITTYQQLMVEVLATSSNVTAVEGPNGLFVTYQIDVETIVDAMIAVTLFFNVEEGPTQSEIDEMKDEVIAMYEDLVDIQLANLTMGVADNGSMNHFGLDLDVTVFTDLYEGVWSDVEPYYDEVLIGSQTVDIDATITFDMTINGNPTITLPTDLDTYPDLNEDPVPVQ